MAPLSARAALLALLQRVPTSVVASSCRVTPGAVRRWASGARAPSARARRLLARFNIPARAWSV